MTSAIKHPPGALRLSEDDRRVLAVWAADCAERTLSLFEARAARERRPRDAIVGLRAFARGEVRIGKVRTLAAQGQAGVAHMAADARGAAAYAAKAAGPAAPRDPTAVTHEAQWQQSHVSPIVRDVLRRLPPPISPAGVLGALISDLHMKLIRDGQR